MATEYIPKSELVMMRDAVRERRSIIENLVARGWQPKRIAEHLFYDQRHLVPSDSLEAAQNLIYKDIERMFIDEGREDLAKRSVTGKKLLGKRLQMLLDKSWENYVDPAASEAFKATQGKLFFETAVKAAKLDGVDVDKLGNSKAKETWEVQIGDGGVVAAREIGGDAVDDDEGGAN